MLSTYLSLCGTCCVALLYFSNVIGLSWFLSMIAECFFTFVLDNQVFHIVALFKIQKLFFLKFRLQYFSKIVNSLFFQICSSFQFFSG